MCIPDELGWCMNDRYPFMTPAAPVAGGAVVVAAAVSVAAGYGACMYYYKYCGTTDFSVDFNLGLDLGFPCLWSCKSRSTGATAGSAPYFGQEYFDNTLFSDGDWIEGLLEEAVRRHIQDVVEGTGATAESGKGRAREVQATDPAKRAKDVFDELKEGANRVQDPNYPGELYKFPDGSTVGRRVDIDGNPTIDLPPGFSGDGLWRKLKFVR